MACIMTLSTVRATLSKLVNEMPAGEEIIITKRGKPVARLVALPRPRLPRKPGGWEGKVWMSEDFDAPLPDDILDAFEGKHDKFG
jgi:prevent-host-death family protein